MHVNRFFIKLNLYKRQYWACLSLHHRTPSMSFACKPYFVLHLLRGLFRCRTADADIEFKFIQGRHNIRQYRGRQRGHWNANRLLGLWQQGKEIGPDDNASKPLQFVKKAALCHKTGMDFNTSGATALKRIIFRNGRKEIKEFPAAWLVSKLWVTCKVGAFRLIAMSFEGPAEERWLMADLQCVRRKEWRWKQLGVLETAQLARCTYTLSSRFVRLTSGLFSARVSLARLARSIKRRDRELGGLGRPSAIINYLQVLQNNNTKKCKPSISPPFTRNQYQYLMQRGWKMSRDMGHNTSSNERPWSVASQGFVGWGGREGVKNLNYKMDCITCCVVVFRHFFNLVSQSSLCSCGWINC